ncbi:unnamed protein product, partial [Phaeothamnion confervicola]
MTAVSSEDDGSGTHGLPTRSAAGCGGSSERPRRAACQHVVQQEATAPCHMLQCGGADAAAAAPRDAATADALDAEEEKTPLSALDSSYGSGGFEAEAEQAAAGKAVRFATPIAAISVTRPIFDATETAQLFFTQDEIDQFEKEANAEECAAGAGSFGGEGGGGDGSGG